jgi:hypothetical protein
MCRKHDITPRRALPRFDHRLIWACRLAVQFTVFDACPYLQTLFLKFGYRGLTLVFSYLVVVYSWAALSPLPAARPYFPVSPRMHLCEARFALTGTTIRMEDESDSGECVPKRSL